MVLAMTIQCAPLQDEVSLDGRGRLWRMLQLRRRVRAITLSPPPPRGGAEARPEPDEAAEAAAADGVVEVEADE